MLAAAHAAAHNGFPAETVAALAAGFTVLGAGLGWLLKRWREVKQDIVRGSSDFQSGQLTERRDAVDGFDRLTERLEHEIGELNARLDHAESEIRDCNRDRIVLATEVARLGGNVEVIKDLAVRFVADASPTMRFAQAMGAAERRAEQRRGKDKGPPTGETERRKAERRKPPREEKK